MRKSKLIKLILFISILFGGIVMGIWICNSPSKIFYREYHFALPSSSIIEKCSYSIINNSLYMKIRLNEEDYEKIESELLEYYKTLDSHKIDDFSVLPHFENICSWWDLDQGATILAYHTFMSGQAVKTKHSYLFVNKCKDDEYCLYIANSGR